MKRVFTSRIDGENHKISGDLHKHIAVVLRAKIGQVMTLCCGDGFIYEAEIITISKNETIFRINSKQKDNSEPNIKLDLFLGIIKGDHLEIALQKATELGVNQIYPIVTKHTVKTDVNIERLNKIILEAANQCGRGRLPKLNSPQKITEIYKDLNAYDLVVFPYENAVTPDLKALLSATINPKNIAVIIGPEGGFSELEVGELSKVATPISLGHRILRADTAVIATLSSLMYHYDEFKR